jgi:hypothetical protein
VFLSASFLYAEENTPGTFEAVYGVSVSHINTGTGHGPGYAVNANVNKGRKTLEVGLVYSNRDSKIGGADFRYRVLLGDISRIQGNDKLYTAYLQYNLMYQKGMSYSPDLVTLGDTEYEVESDPGVVATMGHFIAYGNKIKLFNNVYVDASLGLGYYVGSLDKINGPGTFGIHNENSGLTYSLKVGIGYTFR